MRVQKLSALQGIFNEKQQLRGDSKSVCMALGTNIKLKNCESQEKNYEYETKS